MVYAACLISWEPVWESQSRTMRTESRNQQELKEGHVPVGAGQCRGLLAQRWGLLVPCIQPLVPRRGLPHVGAYWPATRSPLLTGRTAACRFRRRAHLLPQPRSPPRKPASGPGPALRHICALRGDSPLWTPPIGAADSPEHCEWSALLFGFLGRTNKQCGT